MCRDADGVGVAIGWSPLCGPHISTGAYERFELILGTCYHIRSSNIITCEKQFVNARATARFEGGRAMELLIQANMMM